MNHADLQNVWKAIAELTVYAFEECWWLGYQGASKSDIPRLVLTQVVRRDSDILIYELNREFAGLVEPALPRARRWLDQLTGSSTELADVARYTWICHNEQLPAGDWPVPWYIVGRWLGVPSSKLICCPS